MNGGSTTVFDLVLSLEVRAARVEAALDAVPHLAQQWRAEVGIAEAVATIGLEDVRLAETDLLHRSKGLTARNRSRLCVREI